MVDQFLHVYGRAAERVLCLARRVAKSGVEIFGAIHPPHTLSTAASHRFEEYRVSAMGGKVTGLSGIVCAMLHARHDRNTRCKRQLPRRGFRSHLADGIRRGPD